MFFDDWSNIYRVVVVGVLAYAGLVLLLRLSGNRTLSKMNSFDLVVTVAFGSTLSAILVNQSVTLAVGLTALALLILLQLVITWCSVRSSSVNGIVKTAPTVLALDGQLRHDAMRRVRVTSDEVMAAVRQQGHGALENIDAVVLETDGSLSVIPSSQAGTGRPTESCSSKRGRRGVTVTRISHRFPGGARPGRSGQRSTRSGVARQAARR